MEAEQPALPMSTLDSHSSDAPPPDTRIDIDSKSAEQPPAPMISSGAQTVLTKIAAIKASEKGEDGKDAMMSALKMSQISESLDITIQNIEFSVKIKLNKEQQKKQGVTTVDKVILTNISGCFRAGRLTAVMGASGAGKTSLLNVLAGEARNGTTRGTLKINNRDVAIGREMKNYSGFVFQDDVILDTMTVREAITMSATLRLPATLTKEEKKSRVQELLTILRLNKCSETIIGNTTVKGISGGERKRTALAMEMVTNPSILFLDEPTSGLDTFTAFNVCDILRNLSHTGRTVIATIHQPSSETFYLFDDLCLLAEGRVMYWGPIHEVVSYFANLGYPCPNYTNPADYLFMSILNTENKQKAIEADMEADRKRIRTLLDRWQESPQGRLMQQALTDRTGFSKQSLKYYPDFQTQFFYLMGRAGKNALRNKFIIRVKMFQSLFIALLIGLIYLNLPSKPLTQQIQNYGGALFFVAVNMVMGSSIGVLNVFASEKAVFIREHTNGYYSLAAYFVSKTIVELPHQVIFPFIQAIIMYWMVGFTNDPPYAFLVFALSAILLSNCGSALGIFFASVFPDLQVALAVTPMVLLPLMIFSGLFVNNGSIPPYFDWIKYLSPIKYGFEAMYKNQFQNWSYTEISGVTAVTTTGDQLISNLGFDDGLTISVLLLILFAMYIALCVLAYLALKRAVYVKFG